MASSVRSARHSTSSIANITVTFCLFLCLFLFVCREARWTLSFSVRLCVVSDVPELNKQVTMIRSRTVGASLLLRTPFGPFAEYFFTFLFLPFFWQALEQDVKGILGSTPYHSLPDFIVKLSLQPGWQQAGLIRLVCLFF